MLPSRFVQQVLALETEISAENRSLLPDLSVFRRYETSAIEAIVYTPVICLILQGAKEATIGKHTVTLQKGDALLVSHDLPVIARITQAGAEVPYLALILSLDLSIVRSLYDQVGKEIPENTAAKSLCAGPADPAWVAPLGRYLDLVDKPLDARVLGPSLRREIHFRLMMSPIGGMLCNLLSIDSHASRIGKAILKIREDFNKPLAIQELASHSGMSLSSFHAHFKAVTGTTPLQYQKDLRMITARALIQSGRCSVSASSFEVGYESPTHFTRDYVRKFGLPPSREIHRDALARP